jgi:hypothetical protein
MGPMSFRLFLVTVAGCKSLETPAVHIEPEQPTSEDDLVALPAPGPDELWSWEWTRNGEIEPSVRGDRVPAALTARGEVWAVTARSHAGGRVSDRGTDEVSIANSPPRLEVRLSPEPIQSGVELTALVTASDPDDDPITLSYSWTRDGLTFPQDVPTVPASEVLGGQLWSVRVTASDGLGETTATAEGTSQSTEPRVTSARIEPSEPDETSELAVVWDGLDLDGDPIEVRVEWEVDGVPVQQGATLDSAFFSRDDEVRAWLTPSDGHSEGARFPTSIVIVRNTPPSATQARVAPDPLTEGLIASCGLEDAVDLDGDPVTAVVRWYVGGTWVSSDEVLTGLAFSEGDLVACEATPTDGTDEGVTVYSNLVEVVNSPPQVGVVTLDPAVPTAAGPVTAQLDGVYDPDVDDEVEVLGRWYVDGTLVQEGLSLDGLVRGQEIYVEMVADDGEDFSAISQSAVVVVANAPPTVVSAEMSPATPTADDEVTAEVLGVDADSDPVTFEIEWFVDDVSVFVGTPLPAGLAQPGDRLRFVATPSDPSGPGVPASSPEVVVGS